MTFERGDLVDITGTPCWGLVLCVDGNVAWCRVTRVSPLSGRGEFSTDRAPHPFITAGLEVVEKGLPVIGEVS